MSVTSWKCNQIPVNTNHNHLEKVLNEFLTPVKEIEEGCIHFWENHTPENNSD